MYLNFKPAWLSSVGKKGDIDLVYRIEVYCHQTVWLPTLLKISYFVFAEESVTPVSNNLHLLLILTLGQ